MNQNNNILKVLPVRKLPYLKKGSDHVRSRLPDQKIYVTALIRFVYGPNKLPLLTKAFAAVAYKRDFFRNI